MPQRKSKSVIIKPSPYSQELVEALRPYAEIKKILPARRLNMLVGDAKYCYLILDGKIELRRLRDDLLYATVSSPSIFGIARMVMQSVDTYLKTLTPTLVGKMTLERAEEIINEKALWEPLAKHAMVVIEKMYHHNQQMTAPSAYGVVCAQLKELMSEEALYRSNITAERYIRNKVTLSRSRVMQILSDLKQGGHVELERGKLVRIVNLPEKY